MKKTGVLIALLILFPLIGAAQSYMVGDYKLALPAHPGQLQWHASGFRMIQSSAKANGQETGIRGQDQTGRLTFMGFLSQVPGQTALTSAKCRDLALEQPPVAPSKKPPLPRQSIAKSEIVRPDGLPLDLVSYTTPGREGSTVYSVRGFLAKGDLCGDLEIYSHMPIKADDAGVKQIWDSYHLIPNYATQFNDLYFYAQILFGNQQYEAAAPIYQQALTKLKDDGSKETLKWRRVASDQAGLCYGIVGELSKAHAIFEAAIKRDPDYPLYYYNLASADAAEKKLGDARKHLQLAFARKPNLNSGEVMPNPSQDESFWPYHNDKEFWAFVTSLR